MLLYLGLCAILQSNNNNNNNNNKFILKKKKKNPHIKATPLGDWAKEREEVVPSQSMALRPRNNKGTNVPPAASELV